MVRQANIDDGVKNGMPLAEQADVVPALREPSTGDGGTKSAGVAPRTSPRTRSENDGPARLCSRRRGCR